MPFKTKKKKLKAAGRRFAFDEGVVKIIDEGRKKLIEVEVKKEPQVAAENLSYIRGDLLKIIITSVFIGGAQILLRLTLSK
ncbi:hypothetical protein HYW40_00240 [Candidatus Curtissbacteria bacterium]|nr:hypothetical protein [Candidatus Curtissbacteria bacterium]